MRYPVRHVRALVSPATQRRAMVHTALTMTPSSVGGDGGDHHRPLLLTAERVEVDFCLRQRNAGPAVIGDHLTLTRASSIPQVAEISPVRADGQCYGQAGAAGSLYLCAGYPATSKMEQNKGDLSG